jgi:hypothetical protein
MWREKKCGGESAGFGRPARRKLEAGKGKREKGEGKRVDSFDRKAETPRTIRIARRAEIFPPEIPHAIVIRRYGQPCASRSGRDFSGFFAEIMMDARIKIR